ncbi:MAG: SAVED domain-containing protein [Nitrospirae bacterium]|nr:SAVED domain-containing protein [Nitrospirota bacterium]
MWEFVGRISNIVQLVSVFPWLFTAYFFWRRAKRYKTLLQQEEQAVSNVPFAIAIGLIGTGDISGQVSQFLKNKNLQMGIEPLFLPSGQGITKDNMQDLLHKLLKIKSKLTDKGATEVHLFIASPVAFGVAIGAILDNWIPVKVYHKSHTGDYEFWTKLHKGYIPGLDHSLLKDVMDAEL